jgi:N6-adenosine-specific RNA methylase IME4
MTFDGLPRNHFGAILADPPWGFTMFNSVRAVPCRGEQPYPTMQTSEISAVPVNEITAEDSVLFLWITWPMLLDGLRVMEKWGFEYKTCGFCWIKGNSLPLFPDDFKDSIGLGFWTRANSEVCLLGTRGKPKRLNADVRQVFQESRRQHSRKPDGIHERIERLVAGPYLELFARQQRPGWTVWGNETNKFGEAAA